jgi:hypothetical protein
MSIGVEMTARTERNEEGKKTEIQPYDYTLKKEMGEMKYLLPFPHEEI